MPFRLSCRNVDLVPKKKKQKLSMQGCWVDLLGQSRLLYQWLDKQIIKDVSASVLYTIMWIEITNVCAFNLIA